MRVFPVAALRLGKCAPIIGFMGETTELLVFTDLDGTLIDHDTYAWSPAKDALDALKNISAGVILASSKTAAEIAPLRAELDLTAWPSIVENGAGLLEAETTDILGAAHYEKLRSAMDGAPGALRRLFRGFGDMTAAQVIEVTGLSSGGAMLAKRRIFSEPGLWEGTDAQKQDFVTYLTTQGVIAQQGGRFLTLSFGGNKVDQMRNLIARFQPKHTVALGDAPNDIAMLECADIGVVIHNPHRPPLAPLKGEDSGRIIRSNAAGPTGWNTAMLDLLKTLELDQE